MNVLRELAHRKLSYKQHITAVRSRDDEMRSAGRNARAIKSVVVAGIACSVQLPASWRF